jgi:hypothetical protein
VTPRLTLRDPARFLFLVLLLLLLPLLVLLPLLLLVLLALWLLLLAMVWLSGRLAVRPRRHTLAPERKGRDKGVSRR